MTVTGGSSLPKDDIARMVQEAEQHAEEDRRRKEAAETRNQGEQLVYQTEKLIRDNREQIPADVTAEVETALGDLKDGIAISAIVVLYVILGFVQEYRAEQAIAALKKMAIPRARGLRGGEWQEVPAQDLVPGDILQLETGNVLPADARLFEAVNLRVQEAALTGEQANLNAARQTLVELEARFSELEAGVAEGEKGIRRKLGRRAPRGGTGRCDN